MLNSAPASCLPRRPSKRRGSRVLHRGGRVLLILLAVGALLCLSRPAAADAPQADDAVLTALGRSLAWLAAHPSRLRPSGPQDELLGEAGMDLLTWYLFASFHPEQRVRRHAGEILDERLRDLPTPSVQDLNSLAWWSTLLRLVDLRGLETAPARAALEQADLISILGRAKPTTRWWTAELLRRSGLDVDADFAWTFIAAGATAPARDDKLTVGDGYRLFHELIPATDLGREKPRLTGGQRAFVLRILPRLIELTRAAGDTDAVAEVLVCAALMEQRETPAYREALAWLLRRQHPEGSYRTARDLSGERAPVSEQRHVVEVASWALLGSIGSATGSASPRTGLGPG